MKCSGVRGERLVDHAREAKEGQDETVGLHARAASMVAVWWQKRISESVDKDSSKPYPDLIIGAGLSTTKRTVRRGVWAWMPLPPAAGQASSRRRCRRRSGRQQCAWANVGRRLVCGLSSCLATLLRRVLSCGVSLRCEPAHGILERVGLLLLLLLLGVPT